MVTIKLTYFCRLLTFLGKLGSLFLPDTSALGLVEDQAGGTGKLVGGAVDAIVEPDNMY